MFKKIAPIVKKIDKDIVLNSIIGGTAGLAFYYYALYKLRSEMFNQISCSIDALGLTETVVEHMKDHVYPKL